MAQTLAGWTELGPRFEEIVAAFKVWPAVIDVATHEQDISGAVGQPGARDTEVIRQMSGWLIARLRPPVRLRVTVEDTQIQVGPDGGPVLGLTTTRYEPSAGAWAGAAGASSRPSTGPATRPWCSITWWSSGRPGRTSSK
jgi:hypothetical protein